MFNSDGAMRVQRLVAWRAARVGFGATLIVGALAVADAALGTRARDGHAETAVLGLSTALWFAVVWGAALVVGLAAAAATRLRKHLPADTLLQTGAIVPAIGLALMTPLTMQLPVVLAIGSADEFGEWVLLSLVITGAAHVTLALMSAWRARQLVRGVETFSVRAIYLTVIAVSAMPFAVLLLVPPLLVAITGGAYLPVLHWQGRVAAREHQLIATVPRARALAA